MNKKSPISVRTGSSSYPVIFGDFRRTLKRYLGEADKIVVISNATVYALHGDRFVREFLPGNKKIIPLMIGDGEKYKSQATVNLIYEHLFDIGLERRDAVVALGGGVVGDVAGFAAATYKRGVSLIQAPTTLLSMVDSSIGGKTGVNHRQGKNLIGTFYQPRMTLINPIWLATLGSREMIDGLAEIIKTGFISSKKLLMEAAAMEPVYVSGDRDRYGDLIRSAAAFKAKIVSQDAQDFGVRAILNFGHTFGHAIEKAEGYRRYHHGEAVLAGMAGALYLSHAAGRLSDSDFRKGLQYLRPFTDRLRSLNKSVSDYMAPMAVDKKGRGGRLIFVLLDAIGRPAVREVSSKRRILESVKFMIDFINIRGMV